MPEGTETASGAEKYGIGQTVPRFEDPRLLSGGGRYADDVTYPGMAYSVVVRSPHAHARIVAVETAAARALPGVLMVATGADWAASGFAPLAYNGPPTSNKQGIKPFLPRRPALALDRVRHVGDAVAYVVAETLAQAKDAAEAVAVTYEPLPATLDTAGAALPGASAVWDEKPDNVAFIHEAGDEVAADEGIAGAAHVFRRRLVITRLLVNTMELRGCVAFYDPRADHTTVHAPVQSAYFARADYARIFGEPESKFRVVCGDVGGSFGMKGSGYAEQVLPVWAARTLGRPVKWVPDRSDGCLSDNHARDNISDAVLALDKDGRFVALKVHTYASLGGYPSWVATGAPTNNIGSLAGVYTTPACHVRVTGVYTNNTQTCAYRGAGRPEAAYVIERMIDIAAQELGIDPVELRRCNMIPPITSPYKTGLVFTYDSGDFEALMDEALMLADYAGFPARRAAAAARGALRGIGVACTIERAGPPGFEAVQIRIEADGSVQVRAGTTDQGQGHATMYRQIVADRLGVDPARVHVVEGDTDALAYGSGTGGSRVSTLGGSAALNATDKVIAKGRKIAAHALEVAEEDIVFRQAAFTVSGTDRSIALAEIGRRAQVPGLLPPGVEPGLAETGSFIQKTANFPNGCQVMEVEIDPETGTVTMANITVVDDVGTVINPLAVKGQIHGGVAMGIGQALFENAVYDAEGQLLTGSFMDYAMPRADYAPEPTVKSHPVPTPTNPLGVKGVGEAGTVGALPAAMNAVLNALQPLGIAHLDMPLSSERLWRAIRDAKAGT